VQYHLTISDALNVTVTREEMSYSGSESNTWQCSAFSESGDLTRL